MIDFFDRVKEFALRRINTKYEKKFAIEWCVTAAITAVILTLFISWPFFDSIGNLFYDRIQTATKIKPSDQIVVIAIDDKSISNLGGWPLSRTHYTHLLKKLADSKNLPRVIGFDILFLDDTPADLELAEQMARHHVVLPQELRYQEQSHRKQPVMPVEPLQVIKPSYGHIEISYDSDGVIRGSQLYSSEVPHFSLSLAGKEIRLSGEDYKRFPMVDSSTGFQTISLSDVLDDDFPLDTIKDKYLLVGATAVSLGDRYPTVYSGSQGSGSPGVEIHASLLNALLQGDLIDQAPSWMVCLFSFLALIIALMSLLILSPAAEMTATVSVIILLFVFSYLALVGANTWLNPLPAVVVIVLVKPVWAWRRMEMITHFMQEKTEDLQHFDEDGKKVARSTEVGSSRSSFVQYTQMLSEAIQSANERLNFLALVISEIPEAVLIADETGRIMRHNQKMGAIFDERTLKKGNLISRLFAHLKVFSSDRISEILVRPYSEERFAAVDKNGSLREFRMRVLPLPLSTVSHWRLMMMVDITDLVNLQKQRDRTLAILTHDMRTPVASILAICRSEDVSPKGQQDQVASIRKHSHFLLAMMDDFILSIRAESDTYRMEETLIETLLDEAMYQVRELMQSREMTIIYDSAEPVFLEVDARLMTRVIVNLLGNAIRYGAFGSKVSIKTNVVELLDGSSQLTIAITNQVADHASVNTKAPENKGFGMGLEFIRTVIGKHSGNFRQAIPSDMGALARVEIDLPCISLS
jgi:CHASE2 domain-containing sensor protein